MTTARAEVDRLADAVPPGDETASSAARERAAALATPPGALGSFVDIAVVLAASTRRCPPALPRRPALLIAAADHGVHRHGVTMWDQGLSASIAASACAGDAASAVLARRVGAELVVLDVGLAHELPDAPGLRRHRVANGTRDLRVGAAMSPQEAVEAMAAGAATTRDLVRDGVDLLALGDIGIGNTTSTAALTALSTGADPVACTGRGAGADDPTLARKRIVVAEAVQRARAGGGDDPFEHLCAVGGLEHAALIGAMFAAATARVPVLLDGSITGAAALVATALAPAMQGHLLASHRAAEPAGSIGLDHLGLEPILDLGLRLGEGSGALLAVPIVQAAAAVLSETALLEDLRTNPST